MFQFLIGWLQTIIFFTHQSNEVSCFNSLQVGYKPPSALCTSVTLKRFQFLIGWLQTVLLPWVILAGLIQFQFLIGWLQTKMEKLDLLDRNLVSIPHRLATNSGNLTDWTTSFTSFNSSQVGYKLRMWLIGISLSACFNSSQVGYKQFISATGCKSLRGVSIPHRLATNFQLIKMERFIFLSFNSSQVGYKPCTSWR